MSDIQDVKMGMRENHELNTVEFGPVVNGVLHPLGVLRQGDYQEAQELGEQTIADEKATSKGSK